MSPRRVVVTGLGALTPIGNSVPSYWKGLISGKSGAAPITYFDATDFKTQFACELKGFNPLDHFDRKEARKQDRFTQYALVSSDEAILDAGITTENVDQDRVGVIWGAGIGGFNAMHALSTRNDDPATASRPFDKNRDGFVLGEGAGAIILEEYEHAKARGAKIYCELAGGGLSADAHHMTAPHPEGLGAKNVMINCLRNANLQPTDVDAINMHGTSTPLGDIAESKAIQEVFGDHAYNININSTKSMTGHLLGAAGAVEAIASILAIKENMVPPTINHQTPDENIDPKLNFTFGEAQKREVKVALSNTFGFGGHNACVIFKEID